MRCFLGAFCALVSVLVLFNSELELAEAQEFLIDADVPIAEHNRRSSANLLLSQNSKEQDLAWAISFRASIFEPPDENQRAALNYQHVPLCTEARTHIEPVYQDTPGSEYLDLVIYSAEDSIQRNQAQAHQGKTLAYDPLLKPDPLTGRVNPLQEFGRMLNPECLPMRFRFVYVGSKRYQEIRYGGDVWSNAAR